MGKLAKCLDKLRKAFSDQDRAKILEYNDKYKAEGKSDAEAENLAILDFKEDLNNDLNELKEKVKIKLDKASEAKLEVENPKSTEKRDKINNVISKIDAYNALSKKEKKGVVGNRIYNEIQALIKDLGFSIERLKNKGRFRLVSDKGKKVNKSPKKRTPEQIEADSKDKALRKRALNAIPTSVEHSVIMDIANGYQFNLNEFERISGIASSEVPPLLFTKKGGISFEFYKERLNDKGFNTILDEQEIQEIVKDVLVGFADKKVHRDFREKAIREAIEIYNENDEFNQGKSPDEIAYLEDLQRKENEARDAAERLINERELSDIEVQEKLAEDEARAEYEKVVPSGDQYQKKAASKGDVQKVLDRIKKVMPKVNVVIDEKLDAAGKVQGNTLIINPYYAGTDTPIHEAGHILIDALGYKNALIQAAVKQLKDTKLWKETKERYSELNDEMLAKEVLAEAIGREGANIFDKEIDKSKFRAILDRIFEKLKQLLGIDKNIAKSLARQIIRGEGTKDLVGTSAEEQFAKRKISDEEQEVIDLIELIKNEPDLNKFSPEQLIDVYNSVMSTELSAKKKTKYLNEVMTRISMHIYDRGVAKAIKENPSFNPEEASRRDITYKDVKLKVLSHFTDAFPTMQYLSDLWDEHFFNKVTETREKRKNNEELALAVIKERNKRLGISVQRGKEFLQSLYSNINHKYFDYLDNGKGQLITLSEAKQKNLSEAQINYLKFVRELLTERKKLISDKDVYDSDMEILKMDKGYYEAKRTDGLTQAFSNLIGNTHNLEKVRIEFTNPNTGKSQVADFSTIEKILVDYGKKGIAQKAKSLLLITKYNMKARRQLRKGVNVDQSGDINELKVVKGGEYTLDENGQLQSKFSRKRDPNRAYSKDFYRAVHEYIDDNAHIKHISPLVPIINSIEHLAKKGFVRDGKVVVGSKDYLAKWLEEWQNLHVLKKPNEGVPELDLALRTLRFMTSASTMLFNAPANIINVAVGNYNNFREEGLKTLVKGQARLFGGTKRHFGVLNKYALDILKKYGAVSTDVESNPIRTATGKFFELGYFAQKWGEFQIQGSGLLGLMTEDEYNSFEYKKNKYGVEELVVKDGVDEKALRKSILSKINQVSDVQGKYSDKDKMNIVNNELGKAAFQMKTWMPMYFRARFGEKGSVKIAWDNLIKDGFKELRDDMREKGTIKAFWENKAFMKNLRGLMFTGLLLSLVYRDDDDDEKSEAAKLTERLLSDVLFIFDPNNLKFTLTRPIASIGVIEKLINSIDHLFAFESDDFYKADSKYGSKGDPKILGDIIGLTPGKKIVDVVEDLTDED